MTKRLQSGFLVFVQSLARVARCQFTMLAWYYLFSSAIWQITKYCNILWHIVILWSPSPGLWVSWRVSCGWIEVHQQVHWCRKGCENAPQGSAKVTADHARVWGRGCKEHTRTSRNLIKELECKHHPFVSESLVSVKWGSRTNSPHWRCQLLRLLWQNACTI